MLNTNGTKKNDGLANLITSRLNDFKYENQKMSAAKKGIEKPNEIVDIVEKIIYFNDGIQSGQELNTRTNSKYIINFFSTINSRK